MPDKPTHVSTQKLAEHVDKTPQRINQYVTEGMPKAERNTFDLDACCRWIREYERRVWEAEAVPKEEALEYWSEQAKLSRLKQLKEYDQLLIRRRELIPTNELKPLLDRILGSLKDNLLGTGRKLAPQLKGKSESQIAEAVEDAIRRQLDNASRALIRVADLRRPTGAGGVQSEPGETPAKADAQPVGGLAQNSKSRKQSKRTRPVAD